jgi:hypothetical protein
MTALFVPFTLTHGPTSYNLEQELFGRDMHFWGLLLGVTPNVLIGTGLWALRGRVAGPNRIASVTCATACIVLWLSAALDLAFRALGPPFGLLILAPAVLVASVTATPQGPSNRHAQVVLGALGAVLTAACVMALIPMETSDSFGGYRIFGLLAYATTGIMWAVLGLVLSGPDETDG